MINNFRFADDIDLVEESCVALQNSVKLLSEAWIDAGLRINIEKTKTMIFGKEDIEQQIEVLNSRIENVNEFVLFGRCPTRPAVAASHLVVSCDGEREIAASGDVCDGLI